MKLQPTITAHPMRAAFITTALDNAATLNNPPLSSPTTDPTAS